MSESHPQLSNAALNPKNNRTPEEGILLQLVLKNRSEGRKMLHIFFFIFFFFTANQNSRRDSRRVKVQAQGFYFNMTLEGIDLHSDVCLSASY